MEFLNKIELKGVVGRATSQRFGDKEQTTFSVVTEYAYQDTSGAVVDTQWHNCTKWWKEDESRIDLKRGDWVHLVGRLRSRKYLDQNNNERISWDVLVQSIELLTPDKCDLEQD